MSPRLDYVLTSVEQGGKIIILEEASRLNEEVFTEVVIPLLGVRDTTLIGISTPLEASNFYSQLLLAKKPNGKPLFKTMNVQLVCEACRAKGEMSCGHQTQLPSWKTAQRGELVKTLMSNHKEMFLREQQGVITNSDQSAFDHARVESLCLPENCVSISNRTIGSSNLFLAVDPCGGGASSIAIMAAYVHIGTKTLVVVGGDFEVIKDDTGQEMFLNRFMERLRGHQELGNVPIICMIERNYGGSVLASRISNILGQYQPIQFMSSDKDVPGKPKMMGFITSDASKERSRCDLQRLMRLDLIRLSSPCISSKGDALWDDLRKQLMNFRFIITEADHERHQKKHKISLSGKTFGMSDDLAMVLMILSFWPAYCEANSHCLM